MKLANKIFLLLLVVFLFYSLVKSVFNFKDKLALYQSFANDYSKKKKENAVLKTEVLKNKDLTQVEKTIRNKLNLSKPDETAIMLDYPTPTPIAIAPTPLPNWLKWWKVFTN